MCLLCVGAGTLLCLVILSHGKFIYISWRCVSFRWHLRSHESRSDSEENVSCCLNKLTEWLEDWFWICTKVFNYRSTEPIVKPHLSVCSRHSSFSFSLSICFGLQSLFPVVGLCFSLSFLQSVYLSLSCSLSIIPYFCLPLRCLMSLGLCGLGLSVLHLLSFCLVLLASLYMSCNVSNCLFVRFILFFYPVVCLYIILVFCVSPSCRLSVIALSFWSISHFKSPSAVIGLQKSTL